MSFQNFLNHAVNSFNNFIQNIPQLIHIILQDNLVKFLIFLVLFITLLNVGVYVINIFKELIKIKNKNKNKEVE